MIPDLTDNQEERATVVPDPDVPLDEMQTNDYLDRILRQVLNIEGAR